MDIKIDKSDGQFLEYNTIGGIIDLYFVAGPTPVEAAQQYSEVVGKAVMMPYWGFGFHQCRYGMRDVYEVAEVVANYSQAGIPLETMWTDSEFERSPLALTLTDPICSRLHVPALGLHARPRAISSEDCARPR
jgi:alpha-glucosidase